MISGYIEGYYGRLLSWDDRREIIELLAQSGCNRYIYAPKEDYFHRVGWRDCPSIEYLEKMRETIAFAKNHGVDFIPTLSPGLSYRFTENDYSILIKRLEQFIEIGAESTGLLMDDLPLEYGGDDPAKNHLDLLSKICRRLRRPLLFCPTIYSDELNTDALTEKYLKNLSNSLPAEVTTLWTGRETVSETIDAVSSAYICETFGKRLLFWDNYYCNDYAPQKLFVGPYKGRDKVFIRSMSEGICINATGMKLTDMLQIKLFSSWLNDSEQSYEELMKMEGVSGAIEKILPWFNSPYDSPDPKDLLEISDTPLKFFEDYIALWQTPLKLEWYPYIHNLFTELKFLTGKNIGKDIKRWSEMRFMPQTAKIVANGIVDGAQ